MFITRKNKIAYKYIHIYAIPQRPRSVRRSGTKKTKTKYLKVRLKTKCRKI